ncbi:MAG: hypothetical protein QM756_40145 [Polyangiaceae bacterium]
MRASLLLAFVLPSACGLFLESYRIDDSKLKGSSCQLGEQRCVGDWLVACAESLDRWVDAQTCALPDRCDSRSGACRACAAGEYRCDGSALQVCNGDRSGWDTLETCAANTTCNIKLQACAACTPDEYQCNGSVLTRCTAQGSWGTPTMCNSPELCSVSENRAMGQCLASAGCQAGKYACQDARLVRCDAQGVAWLGVETCASATLCNQTLSAATPNQLPSCVRPSCEADQARCDGNQLQVCSAERTGFSPGQLCSADAPCNPKTKSCGRCTAGEKYCSGADLLSCGDNGTFQKAQTCASAKLCNAMTGACDPPQCDTPGHATCDTLEPVLSECGEDLTLRETYCDTTALCNANDKRCEVARCTAAAVRCDGQRLQHCNAEQTGWVTDNTCGAGSYCDPASKSCVSGACQGSGYRCNDVFLERCTTSGYQRIARCAVRELCHADTGTCDAPQCSAGTFRCLGKSLQKCGSSRQWADFTTCSGQCDDIGGKCL